MSDRDIEVLYVDGCPGREALLPRLPALLAQAGVAAEVVERRVRSDAEARSERFLGSPTLRIDGRDVEPGADARTDFGLKCRLYPAADGLRSTPADEWVLAALLDRAPEPPAPTSAHFRRSADRVDGSGRDTPTSDQSPE